MDTRETKLQQQFLVTCGAENTSRDKTFVIEQLSIRTRHLWRQLAHWIFMTLDELQQRWQETRSSLICKKITSIMTYETAGAGKKLWPIEFIPSNIHSGRIQSRNLFNYVSGGGRKDRRIVTVAHVNVLMEIQNQNVEIVTNCQAPFQTQLTFLHLNFKNWH